MVLKKNGLPKRVLGKIQIYTQSPSDQKYVLDQIKSSGVIIFTGYRRKYKSRNKWKRMLEGKDELWASIKKQKKYSIVTPELLDHLN